MSIGSEQSRHKTYTTTLQASSFKLQAQLSTVSKKNNKDISDSEVFSTKCPFVPLSKQLRGFDRKNLLSIQKCLVGRARASIFNRTGFKFFAFRYCLANSDALRFGDSSGSQLYIDKTERTAPVCTTKKHLSRICRTQPNPQKKGYITVHGMSHSHDSPRAPIGYTPHARWDATHRSASN